jgi:CRISPR-associated protein Csy2
MSTDSPQHAALLVLPRLRVQNANAISSPMTWGFPAITAFNGFMAALARRLGAEAGIQFHGVGVVCHHFEAQVTQGGYVHNFALKKPSIARKKEVEKFINKGTPPSIVEEGHIHLDITLVFDVRLAHHLQDDAARASLAARVGEVVAGMRVAGGSVMPPLPGTLRRTPPAQLVLLEEEAEARTRQFRRLSRRWLPGFALVSADDVLQTRLTDLQAKASENVSQPTLFDAWLDLSRLNHRTATETVWDEAADDFKQTVTWQTDKRPGWLVPLPVGYAALSVLHPPGTVAGARDATTPFRFVESVYSMGQWISPHRLRDTHQLMWRTQHDAVSGLYRCTNGFKASNPSSVTPPVHQD